MQPNSFQGKLEDNDTYDCVTQEQYNPDHWAIDLLKVSCWQVLKKKINMKDGNQLVCNYHHWSLMYLTVTIQHI